MRKIGQTQHITGTSDRNAIKQRLLRIRNNLEDTGRSTRDGEAIRTDTFTMNGVAPLVARFEKKKLGGASNKKINLSTHTYISLLCIHII